MEVTNIEPVDVEKVTGENPQSRFRILDTPILAPGVCGLCGSSGGDGRQFVDFGKQLDWYGAVYFCTFCVGEAATLLGFKPWSNINQILIAHNEMVDKYNDLLTSSMEMENATRLLLRNCRCEPVVSGESFTHIDVEANSKSEPDDPNSDESGSVEGPIDVSASSSDDEPSAKPKRTRRTSSSTE